MTDMPDPREFDECAYEGWEPDWECSRGCSFPPGFAADRCPEHGGPLTRVIGKLSLASFECDGVCECGGHCDQCEEA